MAIIYTKGEEIANSASHGIGIIFGIVAGVILMEAAIANGNPWAIGSVPLYLFGMLASYISSTSYHSCTSPKRKAKLRKFDHAAIYLHIAGTYSPITLITLREVGWWGWGLFIFVWLCAALGVLLSFTKLKEHSNLETSCFVLMGATILLAFQPLTTILSPLGEMNIIYWILAGGASYVIGAIFYSWKSINYMHSIFHLFCLGGSVCHAIAIYLVL
ncbi:MAG: hemolysin III family protein [Bacteroides sp.]